MNSQEHSNDGANRFKTVWDHVESGIVVIDEKTREILDVNPAAIRMFGGTRESFIGKRCQKVFCPAQPCPILELNQTVDCSERKFVKADGTIDPIIKSVAKIEYDGRPALLESFIDLSLLKASAEAAEAKAESARQAQMTEHLKQTKRNFLSRISHEMRTPMNVILGMMQIAKDSEDIAELKYCFDRMADAGEQLFELINDFFNMSEIDAGKFELDHTPINIEKTLLNVCSLMKEKIEGKNIKFSIIFAKDMRMNYLGDESRLSQVVNCLLSNAVKFTEIGGNIRINVDETQSDEDCSVLQFSIEDNGIGMTEEQLVRIWDDFEQAETDTFHKYGGVGIGLSIAKSIVEKMEGRIWARSAIHKGSTFCFEVRLRRARRQNGPIIVGSIRASDIKVLIADGDEEARNYFKSIIDGFGMNADAAETVERADSLVKLAKAAGHPYDIIFCDYGLSELDGIKLAKRIRPSIDKNTFVVLVTSSLKWNTVERYARSVGIDMHISKPLFPSVLMDLINEIVSRSVRQFDIKSEHTLNLPDLSNIKLLFAEDDEINMEIVISLLKETKIKIDYVENGAIALEKFQQSPDKYDMIITDVQMPEMDGYGLTAAIRSLGSDRAQNIPIIALTAGGRQEDIRKCFASGMNDHLAKPVDIYMLCEKIQQHKSRT